MACHTPPLQYVSSETAKWDGAEDGQWHFLLFLSFFRPSLSPFKFLGENFLLYLFGMCSCQIGNVCPSQTSKRCYHNHIPVNCTGTVYLHTVPCSILYKYPVLVQVHCASVPYTVELHQLWPYTVQVHCVGTLCKCTVPVHCTSQYILKRMKLCYVLTLDEVNLALLRQENTNLKVRVDLYTQHCAM